MWVEFSEWQNKTAHIDAASFPIACRVDVLRFYAFGTKNEKQKEKKKRRKKWKTKWRRRLASAAISAAGYFR